MFKIHKKHDLEVNYFNINLPSIDIDNKKAFTSFLVGSTTAGGGLE